MYYRNSRQELLKKSTELLAAGFQSHMGQCHMQMNTARQLKGNAQGFLGNMSLITSGETFLSKKRGKAGK